MLKKQEFFIIECNHCGNWLDTRGEGGWTVWTTENDAREALMCESEWYETPNGMTYCESCKQKVIEALESLDDVSMDDASISEDN